MSKYTVTIAPDRSETAGAIHSSHMILYIDGGPPEPRVTGIAVNATTAEGLTLQNFPAVDLVAIARALAAHSGGAQPVSQDRPVGRGGVDEPLILDVSSKESAADSVERGSAHTKPIGRGDHISDRAYRRMPDPNELRETYSSIGTVTGLAKHYNVPRHTAQGWMGRLRKLDSAAASPSVPTEFD